MKNLIIKLKTFINNILSYNIFKRKERLMNPRIKRLWIKALESGKYKQTKGVLRGRGLSATNPTTIELEEGFCCLGVLTDLYIKETKKLEWIEEEFGTFRLFTKSTLGDYSFPNIVSYLPKEVCDWAEISQKIAKKGDSNSFNIKTISHMKELDNRTLGSINDASTTFKETIKEIKKF